jgi:hypothetical protein
MFATIIIDGKGTNNQVNSSPLPWKISFESQFFDKSQLISWDEWENRPKLIINQHLITKKPVCESQTGFFYKNI